MTEVVWLKTTEPQAMLDWLRSNGKLTERKSRLFGAACCRRVWHLLTDERSRKAVEVAERWADGKASAEELEAAYEEAFEVGAALAKRRDASQDAFLDAAWTASGVSHPDELAEAVASAAAEALGEKNEEDFQASLLRCIFGNPFQPPPTIEPAVVDWNDGTVVKITQVIYKDRRFEDLPILADALEDAGCDNEDILDHCRQPGEHARGCWVIDLLLGKE